MVPILYYIGFLFIILKDYDFILSDNPLYKALFIHIIDISFVYFIRCFGL